MLSSLLLLGLAEAATPEDWIGTRWQLSVEEVLPVEVDLLAKNNKEFILKALQLRTVVHCTEAEIVGKSLVVTCDFEDVAIQSVPHGQTPTEQEIANSLEVIEDVAAHLRDDGFLEVTFNKHGRVQRVDVTGIEGDNLREKNHRERMRQLGTDLAMGWSIKAPKGFTGTWQEMNDPLLRAPGLPAAGGANATTHSGAATDGRTVVQSLGSGVTSIYYRPWEFTSQNKVARSMAGDQAVEGGGSNIAGQGAVGGSRIGGGTVAGGASAVGATPDSINYDASLRSVAVIDPSTGVITERVWSVAGAGTASAIGSFQGVSLWYNGQLRKLGPDEKPDLGPTRMVHPPGTPIFDLPAWEPMNQ